MILVINDEAVRQADEATRRARADPLTPEEVGKLALAVDPGSRNLKFADRPKLPRIRSHCIEIDKGFRCCISYERQPAGLCKHLSISSTDGLPPQIALEELSKLFGMTPDNIEVVWLEEFEPGKHAVNMVAIVDEEN